MNEKILSIYEKLLARYGDLNWRLAKTPYKVMAGAANSKSNKG